VDNFVVLNVVDLHVMIEGGCQNAGVGAVEANVGDGLLVVGEASHQPPAPEDIPDFELI